VVQPEQQVAQELQVLVVHQVLVVRVAHQELQVLAVNLDQLELPVFVVNLE
jgi:hypothetical protein